MTRSMVALILAAFVTSGCSDGISTDPKNGFVAEVRGSAQEIAEACDRAAFVMNVLSVDEFSPTEAYLDPRDLRGFDRTSNARNRRTAESIDSRLTAIDRHRFGEADRWFDRALAEFGWKRQSEQKVEAEKDSWRRLQSRVDWCFEHLDVRSLSRVEIAPRRTKLVTTVAATAPPAARPANPYRTKVIPGVNGSDPIVVEHQPD